jgi:hypothetical protein
MDRHRNDRLYRDQQQVNTCAVCAGLYPATRRRLARELEPTPVCSDRCLGVFIARQIDEAKRAAAEEQAADIARAEHLVEAP